MANPDGVSDEGVGVHQVLSMLALTKSQVGTVMDYLRGMSFYSAQMTGWQKSTYKVALEPAVITAEMVQEQRTRINRSKVTEAKTETSALADGLNPLDKLAEIIVGLEAQVAELTSKLASAEKRLDTATNRRRGDADKIKRRDAKLAEASAEIDRLKTELSAAQNSSTVVPQSSLAAKVLSRY